MIPTTRSASSRQRSPSDAALSTAPIADGISCGPTIVGNANAIGHFPCGKSLRKARRLSTSPAFAWATIERTISLASAETTCCSSATIRVAAPFLRPAGLPLLPFWNGIAHVVSSNRPSLALSPFVAALEVHIETVVVAALGLGFDTAIFVNPLLGEGSVFAPNLSGPGVANDHEGRPSSPLRAPSSRRIHLCHKA